MCCRRWRLSFLCDRRVVQFSFLRSLLMISRRSSAYSSMIGRASSKRESLGVGGSLIGRGSLVWFMPHRAIRQGSGNLRQAFRQSWPRIQLQADENANEAERKARKQKARPPKA
jgi:hypothetical protein